MKATDRFKKTIKAYLEKRAEEDALFAPAYANPDKNLDDCIVYILNTVKKTGRQGFTDDEVYAMAVHYYDEPDVEIGPCGVTAHVKVNRVVDADTPVPQAKPKRVKKEPKAPAIQHTLL